MAKETEIKIETSTSPEKYFADFSQSCNVDEEIRKIYNRVKENEPSVTLDDIRRVFFSKQNIIDQLWIFYKKNPFVYNPDLVSGEFASIVNLYLTKITEISSKQCNLYYSNNHDAFVTDDMQRRLLHNAAADQLVKEGLPSQAIGRVFVHFIAVGAKLDTPDPNRETSRLRYTCDR